MTPRTLRAFFAQAFGLGWGVLAVLILFTSQIEAIFGEISGTNPVFILAVYSPAIAAVFLVWRHHGVKGLDSYLRRATLWRMPAVWWLAMVLGIPAVKYLGAAINGTWTDFPFNPWTGVLPALVAALLIGPVEEVGWRGLALPPLQRRSAPLGPASSWARSGGCGACPRSCSAGPRRAPGLRPVCDRRAGPVSPGHPMFNAAKGSILVAALFHFQMHNPAWPEAQPWENYLFAAAAVIVVLVCRKAMLGRGQAVTEVLMPREAEPSPKEAPNTPTS